MKCKFCGAEVTIGQRCEYCGSMAEKYYYQDLVLEELVQPTPKSPSKKPSRDIKDCFISIHHTARDGDGKKTHYYIVKKGDTLLSIAKKQLHNENKWPEIARKNNIKEPYRIQPGQKLVF